MIFALAVIARWKAPVFKQPKVCTILGWWIGEDSSENDPCSHFHDHLPFEKGFVLYFINLDPLIQKETCAKLG